MFNTRSPDDLFWAKYQKRFFFRWTRPKLAMFWPTCRRRKVFDWVRLACPKFCTARPNAWLCFDQFNKKKLVWLHSTRAFYFWPLNRMLSNQPFDWMFLFQAWYFEQTRSKNWCAWLFSMRFSIQILRLRYLSFFEQKYQKHFFDRLDQNWLFWPTRRQRKVFDWVWLACLQFCTARPNAWLCFHQFYQKTKLVWLIQFKRVNLKRIGQKNWCVWFFKLMCATFCPNRPNFYLAIIWLNPVDSSVLCFNRLGQKNVFEIVRNITHTHEFPTRSIGFDLLHWNTNPVNCF